MTRHRPEDTAETARIEKIKRRDHNLLQLRRELTILFFAIHPARVHQVSWVVNPDHRDLLFLLPPGLVFTPATGPNAPELIFGMPIRVDPNVFGPALELRER